LSKAEKQKQQLRKKEKGVPLMTSYFGELVNPSMGD